MKKMCYELAVKGVLLFYKWWKIWICQKLDRKFPSYKVCAF